MQALQALSSALLAFVRCRPKEPEFSHHPSHVVQIASVAPPHTPRRLPYASSHARSPFSLPGPSGLRSTVPGGAGPFVGPRGRQGVECDPGLDRGRGRPADVEGHERVHGEQRCVDSLGELGQARESGRVGDSFIITLSSCQDTLSPLLTLTYSPSRDWYPSSFFSVPTTLHSLGSFRVVRHHPF